jgi:hypothetical protein
MSLMVSSKLATSPPPWMRSANALHTGGTERGSLTLSPGSLLRPLNQSRGLISYPWLSRCTMCRATEDRRDENGAFNANALTTAEASTAKAKNVAGCIVAGHTRVLQQCLGR